MIRIKIEHVTAREEAYVEWKVKHEEPALDGSGAPIRDTEYSSSRGVMMKRDYEKLETTRQTTETTLLLSQEIVDDTKFDLGGVILAINGLIHTAEIVRSTKEK